VIHLAVVNRIKWFRKKYKITQCELAEEMNVSKQYISKLEVNKSNLGLDVLMSERH
jgi:transcriptional regulator with XRE-family HTH domain